MATGDSATAIRIDGRTDDWRGRGALYARAVEDFVRRNDTDDLTSEINRVLAEQPQERDSFVDAAATSMLRRSEWTE